MESCKGSQKMQIDEEWKKILFQACLEMKNPQKSKQKRKIDLKGQLARQMITNVSSYIRIYI